jgi:hypothetical protein
MKVMHTLPSYECPRKYSAAMLRSPCPPGAITPQKQMVRGVERRYVDFDKCIPYFAEAASCGIFIAECPFTRPTVRPKLLATSARRIRQAHSQA